MPPEYPHPAPESSERLTTDPAGLLRLILDKGMGLPASFPSPFPFITESNRTAVADGLARAAADRMAASGNDREDYRWQQIASLLLQLDPARYESVRDRDRPTEG